MSAIPGVLGQKPPVLVLATANEHKVTELRQILTPLLPEIDPEQIVSMAQFRVPSPVEDSLTFEGNALIKATTVAEATGLPAIADDSGIVVDALGGSPGVFSARWAGEHGNDGANCALLLAQLADVRDEDRGAAFVCAAALALPDGRSEVAEASLVGRLAHKQRGANGFGYDPIFIPEGHQVTTAEMTAEEKNAISHRGRAFTALAPRIQELLS